VSPVCKICGADAVLSGVVDIAKSCECRNKPYALKGAPVSYHRCERCGFTFTTAFDHWSPDDWKREIYNVDYGAADPDQATGSRARGNVAAVADVARALGSRRILDYGGGDGLLARILTEGFFDAHSWDPLADERKPDGDFDLITAFEVFEHIAAPREGLAELLAFLRPGGAVFFSTMTQEMWDTGHWYCAPRNGHVSLHTPTSLALLFGEGWALQMPVAGYWLARRYD
jgi:SAM-dependent methyltransferase